LSARGVDACTTFCAAGADGPVFGKNYDWDTADGLVMVNKRGVSKTAMTADNPAHWTSKYGSITFNQYGRELPCGGINEAGLVIELMWLDVTVYPAVDSRASLSSLQWIQYFLDTAATVAEVIVGETDVRISRGSSARVHFLVADRSGASATFEFLEGRTVVHTGESLPYSVLTNHPYNVSMEYLSQRKGFGGDLPVGDTGRSLDRFARAARGVRDFDQVLREYSVDAAFDILAAVAQGASTQWSIVYDLDAKRVYFRTFHNPLIRYVDVGGVDFSCKSPVQILDIHADADGDAGDKFEPYTRQANLNLIKSVFGSTDFLQDTPAREMETLADYPGTTGCDR
jgi:choloylglycine hydrolase